MSKLFHDYTFGFVDFPNMLAVTLFFTGCNLSCPYCYNQRVVGGRAFHDLAAIDTALAMTERAMTEKVGIVLSGGEPTANIVNFQKVTDYFLTQNRRIALHTNGLNGFRDVFDSVIVSLKTTHDGVRHLPMYRQRLRSILQNGCKKATYKELRIVDYVGAREERMESLKYLESSFATVGWRVNIIPPQSPEGEDDDSGTRQD